MPQHLFVTGFSTKEQATKSFKELKQVQNNLGAQTSFKIGDIQLHAIDRLAKLFNTMQLDKTQTKVLHREVPTIALPIVPITVPPPRVSATVSPPRVMIPRIPMIS